MNFFFSILSLGYIAGIFLLADSPMVADVATFNPYSVLHIPLYGILTILLILSNWSSILVKRSNPTNSINSINPSNSTNPSNSSNYFIAGIIAFIVAIADEIHQAYLPNRDASFIDVLLDIIGIMLCILFIPRGGHLLRFLKKIT